MSKPKSKSKKTRTGRCMVCDCPIKIKSDFGMATGLGLCKKKSCRTAMVEAGIV